MKFSGKKYFLKYFSSSKRKLKKNETVKKQRN